MVTNPSPFSWGLFFFALFVYILGLSVKQQRFLPRWLFFVAFACICTYIIGFTKFRGTVDNFSIGSLLVTIGFNAMDFLVLRNPQKELRLEDEKAGAIQNEPFLKRLKWSAKLFMCERGVGWVDPCAPKAPHLPPLPSDKTTRKAFILTKVREIAVNMIIFDLAGFANRASPCFKEYGLSVSTSFLWRLELAFGFAAGEMTLVTMVHCLHCILSVGLLRTEPRHWPSVFGSLFDAYTVRRFWGRFWHQFMRRLLVSHGNFLSKKLHLPPRSKLTTCFRIFLGFFISGVIHAGGDYMVFRDWHRGGSLIFFTIQPLGMATELVVITIFQKSGIRIPSQLSRAVGYVWVYLWFAYTLPIMLEPLVRSRFFESGPSFSLILGLWKGEWTPAV